MIHIICKFSCPLPGKFFKLAFRSIDLIYSENWVNISFLFSYIFASFLLTLLWWHWPWGVSLSRETSRQSGFLSVCEKHTWKKYHVPRWLYKHKEVFGMCLVILFLIDNVEVSIKWRLWNAHISGGSCSMIVMCSINKTHVKVEYNQCSNHPKILEVYVSRLTCVAKDVSCHQSNSF